MTEKERFVGFYVAYLYEANLGQACHNIKEKVLLLQKDWRYTEKNRLEKVRGLSSS